ncbi:hypothetical protein BML2537_13410 [Providencia stuartii]|nr:hypothetical protein BML2537_13410 [Providencia stuartii]
MIQAHSLGEPVFTYPKNLLAILADNNFTAITFISAQSIMMKIDINK